MTESGQKTSAREYHLLRLYGITEADYRKILQLQKGCCGVCLRRADTFKTNLAVDHNHATGEIRGLLCIHCNRRVIGRHKDPELFLNAYHYLSKGTGLFVPEKKPKRRKKRMKNAR